MSPAAVERHAELLRSQSYYPVSLQGGQHVINALSIALPADGTRPYGTTWVGKRETVFVHKHSGFGGVLEDGWEHAKTDADATIVALAAAACVPLPESAGDLCAAAELCALRLGRYTESVVDEAHGGGSVDLREHSDESLLTIVYNGGAGGTLQVRSPTGEWVDTEGHDGTNAVVMVGAFGACFGLKPAVHRVVGGGARRSAVFFVNAEQLPAGAFLATVSQPAPPFPVALPHVRLDVASVRAHWRLMVSLVGGAKPLPSHRDHAYWRGAIAAYEAQARRAAAVSSGSAPSSPRLSRAVLHCWLVHMLQPAAYIADCMEHFGRLLPHDNTLADGSAGDEEQAGIIEDESDGTLASNGASLFTHVDWLMGMETVAALRLQVLKDAPRMAAACDGNDYADDAFIQRGIDDYKRFLYACNLSRQVLAPGPIIDLVWHAHQTDPVAYSADFEDSGIAVLDHIPCGEENPPDPEWTISTAKAWEVLFGETLHHMDMAALPGCCCGGGKPKEVVVGHYQVLVPEGKGEGDDFMVEFPDKKTRTVRVGPGLKPGDQMMCEYKYTPNEPGVYRTSGSTECNCDVM